MLHMIPSFKLKTEQKSEFIILIDRSGSMQGNSISLAKEALVVILKVFLWEFIKFAVSN